MPMKSIQHETITFTLEGVALNEHTISARVLAQSLLGIDLVARNAGETIYGKASDIDIKVKALRPGSFNIDLILQYSNTIKTSAEAVLSCGAVILGVIKLAKFLKGKGITEQTENKEAPSQVNITNYFGEVSQFNIHSAKFYQKTSTQIQLDRLTRGLDENGVDTITITADSGKESVTKQERYYFKREDGSVITDEENHLVLEVINASLNGEAKGWRFYDGEREFTANIEDEEFLRRVVEEKIPFSNGTQIEATVRLIQKKGKRIFTERTVLEVHRILNETAHI